MMATEGDEAELRESFQKACAFVKTITANLNSEQLLYFYARYKQANDGQCATQKPGFFDFQGKQKWEAWKKMQTTSTKAAMTEYMDALTAIDPDWELSVDNGRVKLCMGQSVSTMRKDEETLEDDQKTLFDWCVEGDVERVTQCISRDRKCLSQTDENGMTLCHWTCDRGHLDMLQLLLRNDVDVNARDSDGQTPLHYAASCEHEEVIHLLLSHSADINIRDEDGVLPSEATENASIAALLS